MTREPIDITVSWSEISAWRKCPLKHWLSYRQRQPEPSSGPAAGLGTVWHLMQEDWYRGRMEAILSGRSIVPLASSVPAQHLTFEPRSEAEIDQLSTLLWMWDGFLVNGDPFHDAFILGVEQQWVVPLPRVPGQPRRVRFWLKVKMDLVVRRGRRIIIVDHKSQAKWASPDTLSRDMEIDDQLGLYLYAARKELGVPARNLSACWNYAVTTDLKTHPRDPSQRFWQSWSARTEGALDRLAIEATETAMAAYHRPLQIEPPRHPDKEECRWRCGHRSNCYYARDADRPVQLVEPTRADQAPLGVPRSHY